jgi:hypothetical protein
MAPPPGGTHRRWVGLPPCLCGGGRRWAGYRRLLIRRLILLGVDVSLGGNLGRSSDNGRSRLYPLISI